MFIIAMPAMAAPVLSGKIIDLTNQERAKAQIFPLSGNPRLMKAAAILAEDLNKGQYFSDAKRFQKKVSSTLAQVKYKADGVGWIVYAGNANEEQLVAQSMAAPGSKKWLLSKTSTETGVAVVEGKTMIVVQMFGSEKVAKTLASSSATGPVCNRKTPFPIPPEIAGGLEAAFHNPKKYALNIPYKLIKNCLNITFTNKLPEGAIAVFDAGLSSQNNLRIKVNPNYAKSGHEILGAVLAHEITHAWFFDQLLMQRAGQTAYANFSMPECADNEALAYMNEITYINNLSEGDENELRDYIKKYRSLYSADRLGVSDIVYLMDFYEKNYSARADNFTAFLRDNFVLTNDYYRRQCGVK